MASNYRLEITPTASRQIAKLPHHAKKTISAQIDKIPLGAANLDIKKLAGSNHLFRLRVRDYRVIYRVEAGIFIILILKVGQRKDIYRNLNHLINQHDDTS